MKIKIDHSYAEEILRQVVRDVKFKYKLKSPLSKDIEKIILSSHRTYRYIFVTGLLAKSTNAKANPIVLQSGSKLEGSFDARSLCHNVLVKIEREIMNNSLGGSNEPFLNKPARYKELSLTNAVRKGKDKELLELCIEILLSLKDSTQALMALQDAIYYSFLRNPIREIDIKKDANLNILRINKFIEELLSKSCGGESCTIISAIAFEILGLSQSMELKVEIHPINQSGASSKEISDIDVYYEGNLIYTAEVKDKNYTLNDLDHAARKVLENEFDRLLFLKGPNAGFIGKNEEFIIIKKWAKEGVDIFLSNVFDFTITQVYLCRDITFDQIVQMVKKYTKQSRVSDGFIIHAKSCLDQL